MFVYFWGDPKPTAAKYQQTLLTYVGTETTAGVKKLEHRRCDGNVVSGVMSTKCLPTEVK